MAKFFKFVTVLLATTMFIGSAQAAQKAQHPDDIVTKLVKAYLPKNLDTVEGVVNSGSLGVVIFLLCEAGKNSTQKSADKTACPK